MAGSSVVQSEAVLNATSVARGQRSYGPTRAALVHGLEYFAAANEEIVCMPMIETREAVEAIDDILSVPGVDAIYVGPNDLSLSLGLSPGENLDDETLTDALDRIVAGCRRHDVVAGMAGSAKTAAERLRRGFLFVEVSRDAGSMARQASKDLHLAREGRGE